MPECAIINGYGPTENTTFTCCYKVAAEQLNGGVPIGKAIANTTVYLLDDEMRVVPIGAIGELYTGGEGLARGYLGNGGLTAERFMPDPFSKESGARLYRTGDLAKYRADGNLEFAGRIDHQVKIRGFRIELEEIEAVLQRHEAVKQAVVIARENQQGHKQLVAYVTSRDTQRRNVEDLSIYLKGQLPEYMVPAIFVELEELPLTPQGKVDRRALPEPGKFSPGMGQAYAAPRTQTEQILCKLWAEVLGVAHVGIHDNFFELGGDSIISIQIAAQANRAGLRITPTQLFEQPTVAQLAAVAGSVEAGDAEQGKVQGAVPLTAIQRWFLEGDGGKGPLQPIRIACL